VGHATDELLGRLTVGDSTLREDARALDATYQAIVTTSQPVRRNLLGTVDAENNRMVRLVTGTRDYARGLVDDSARVSLRPELCSEVERATSMLRSSLDVLAESVTGSRDVTYTRSGALFDRVERHLEESGNGNDEGQLALRDFVFLDGALASIANVLGLVVRDLDTQNMGDRIVFPTPASI
jgi:hypothetical protein